MYLFQSTTSTHVPWFGSSKFDNIIISVVDDGRGTKEERHGSKEEEKIREKKKREDRGVYRVRDLSGPGVPVRGSFIRRFALAARRTLPYLIIHVRTAPTFFLWPLIVLL